MNLEQTTLVAQQFINQLHRLEEGDRAAADSLASLFADNAALSNPILEQQGRKRSGRADIAGFWREYRSSFGSMHSDFADVTASDHSAGLFWRSCGTGPDGQRIEYDGVTLLTFDDSGKITRMRGYFDPDKVRLMARH
jgi:ketosteroid isomerase-like protein